MGILDRITTLIRANINDLLDRAEDPEKMLNQMITDMEDSVRDGKVALAAAITEEKKLKAGWEENLAEEQKWLQKAELAIEKGAEDLAREALKRHNTHETNALSYKQQWEQQRHIVAQLREDLDQLDSKVAEARSKKELLIARKRRAEAAKKVNEQLAGIGKSATAFENFEKMERKIEHMEAQAQAAAQVRQDSLEERFRKLNEGDDVESDLAALKAKIAAKKAEQGGSTAQ